MRLLAVCLALAMAACARAPQTCDLAATRIVALRGQAAEDVITARTLGATCDKAVALISVADVNGHPIYAFAAPLPRVFGEDYLAPKNDEVAALLERWTQAEIATTASAPPWPQTMLHLPAGALIGLDRLTYEDIRTRDLPMLCHLSAPAHETCVFYEPGAAGAAVLYERDLAPDASDAGE